MKKKKLSWFRSKRRGELLPILLPFWRWYVHCTLRVYDSDNAYDQQVRQNRFKPMWLGLSLNLQLKSYLWRVCANTWTSILLHAHGGQKTAFWSLFSPSVIWILVIWLVGIHPHSRAIMLSKSPVLMMPMSCHHSWPRSTELSARRNVYKLSKLAVLCWLS